MSTSTYQYSPGSAAAVCGPALAVLAGLSPADALVRRLLAAVSDPSATLDSTVALLSEGATGVADFAVLERTPGATRLAVRGRFVADAGGRTLGERDGVQALPPLAAVTLIDPDGSEPDFWLPLALGIAVAARVQPVESIPVSGAADAGQTGPVDPGDASEPGGPADEAFGPPAAERPRPVLPPPPVFPVLPPLPAAPVLPPPPVLPVPPPVVGAGTAAAPDFDFLTAGVAGSPGPVLPPPPVFPAEALPAAGPADAQLAPTELLAVGAPAVPPETGAPPPVQPEPERPAAVEPAPADDLPPTALMPVIVEEVVQVPEPVVADPAPAWLAEATGHRLPPRFGGPLPAPQPPAPPPVGAPEPAVLVEPAPPVPPAAPAAEHPAGATAAPASLDHLYRPEPAAAPPQVPVAAVQQVPAARCPQGHLTPAHGRTCRVCGAPVPYQQPFQAPRPRLGMLRIPHRDFVPLDRDVILGRNPHVPPGHVGEEPLLVALFDPAKDLSSQHLEVQLDHWQVLVRDLGSTNGTQIVVAGQPPKRLRPNQPVVIEPGTQIVLAGVLTITFEAVP